MTRASKGRWARRERDGDERTGGGEGREKAAEKVEKKENREGKRGKSEEG